MGASFYAGGNEGVSERFAKSPIRLRPGDSGSVSIDVGGESFKAEDDEPGGTARVPVPPPKKPPWRAKLLLQGELLSELRIEDGSAEELELALAQHGEVDEVRVGVLAPAVTQEELAPLVRLSRLHGVDIDVQLDADG